MSSSVTWRSTETSSMFNVFFIKPNVARLVRLFDFQKFYFKLSLKNIKKEKKGKQFQLK